MLSPKLFNQNTFLIACPITNQEKGYPFEVKIPSGLKVKGVILTDQIRSVEWRSRNVKIVDQAPAETTDECLKKIATFL